MPICLGDDLQDKEIGAFIINMNWNYILMCTNQRITDDVKNFVHWSINVDNQGQSM